MRVLISDKHSPMLADSESFQWTKNQSKVSIFIYSAHVRKYEFAERAVDLLHQTKSVFRFVRAEVM